VAGDVIYDDDDDDDDELIDCFNWAHIVRFWAASWASIWMALASALAFRARLA